MYSSHTGLFTLRAFMYCSHTGLFTLRAYLNWRRTILSWDSTLTSNRRSCYSTNIHSCRAVTQSPTKVSAAERWLSLSLRFQLWSGDSVSDWGLSCGAVTQSPTEVSAAERWLSLSLRFQLWSGDSVYHWGFSCAAVTQSATEWTLQRIRSLSSWMQIVIILFLSISHTHFADRSSTSH